MKKKKCIDMDIMDVYRDRERVDIDLDRDIIEREYE
tara:strand:- start:55 stop:162 length:108 start_codon:yes stop_codon:yes gene_type:complete